MLTRTLALARFARSLRPHFLFYKNYGLFKGTTFLKNPQFQKLTSQFFSRYFLFTSSAAFFNCYANKTQLHWLSACARVTIKKPDLIWFASASLLPLIRNGLFIWQIRPPQFFGKNFGGLRLWFCAWLRSRFAYFALARSWFIFCKTKNAGNLFYV